MSGRDGTAGIAIAIIVTATGATETRASACDPAPPLAAPFRCGAAAVLTDQRAGWCMFGA
jgi:hypothetical protein